MITPKAEFRPNPNRAIHVQGEIEQSLVQRLTPQILSLQHQSREPITVFIDSPGGSVHYMFALLRLLKATNQDYEKPCRLITVATMQAASAAADLLSAGDYALAYPGSSILYHGVRLPVDSLTAERSSFFAQLLRLNNENSAMDLAREIELRFIFRFITARGLFKDIRQTENKPLMADLDCFLNYIFPKLSESAQGILETAQKRYSRYEELLKTVLHKTKNVSAKKTPLEVEAIQIKAIVDFEVQQNKNNTDWGFHTGGVQRLTDDFLLFLQYQAIAQSDRFKKWCSRFGGFIVSVDEAAEIEQIPDEAEKARRWTEKASPVLQPIWSFFVALCHTLQQGENEFLTAYDTFWLGLIDEVIGDENLFPFRMLQETVPDPTPKKTPKKK